MEFSLFRKEWLWYTGLAERQEQFAGKYNKEELSCTGIETQLAAGGLRPP